MITRFRKFFFEDERTSRLSKNIFYSFGIKGYALFIQLALVPISLEYLDNAHYGVWLVLLSFLDWIGYMDIGIGHGLRNRLSVALAENHRVLARTLVSTAYAIVLIIFGGFILLFNLVHPLVDWQAALNTTFSDRNELDHTVLAVLIIFSVRHILSLITGVIYAKQQPAINSFMGPLGSTVSLAAIVLFSPWLQGSFFRIAMVLSVSPLVVMLIFTLVLFAGRYRDVRPSVRLIDFSYARSLFGLGLSFFIIQISMLILFSSANMVITRFFGPEEVTTYNIAFRYFTILIMVNGMITLPYWSTFTEAYVKKDMDWIRKSIRKLNLFSLVLVTSLLISWAVSDHAVRFWVGDRVSIPSSLKLALVVNITIQLLAAPYNIFINGVSKIRLQLYVAIISILITIPLSVFFIQVLGTGPSGVVMAMICSTLPGGILWRIQYEKIINGRAMGIWDK